MYVALLPCSTMCVFLQLELRQQQMQSELLTKQQQAGDLVKDFKAVEDQVDKVRADSTLRSCI